MKRETIQAFVDLAVKKRLFASFPELKQTLNPKRIEDMRKTTKENPQFQIFKANGENLEELKEILLKSFDNAYKELRENLSEGYDKVILEK